VSFPEQWSEAAPDAPSARVLRRTCAAAQVPYFAGCSFHRTRVQGAAPNHFLLANTGGGSPPLKRRKAGSPRSAGHIGMASAPVIPRPTWRLEDIFCGELTVERARNSRSVPSSPGSRGNRARGSETQVLRGSVLITDGTFAKRS